MSEQTIERKEALWKKGPNYAADAMIVSDNRILLIQRSDTKKWALPGGFIDTDESPLEAAAREAEEESAFKVSVPGKLIYSGRVEDPRNSDERWIETSAFLFQEPDIQPIGGADDAVAARYFRLYDLPDELHGSHEAIIRRGLLAYELEREERWPTRGGHMSYDHTISHTDSCGSVFIKQHIPERHRDAEREQNSRLYLRREAAAFDHLRSAGYKHVPAFSELYDDTTLALEGLIDGDGWHWMAPMDPELIDNYVADCLGALRKLEEVPELPDDNAVAPSISTFYEEGWDSLDDASLRTVGWKLRDMIGDLHPETAAYVEPLIAQLKNLRAEVQASECVISTKLSHHDARQANIAWHPDQGAKIVDWSWAGPGVRGADTTSLLIDIAKSGHDVSAYMGEYFNSDHAKLLIGFWLEHSLWEVRPGNESVRLHQAASALTAYQLLELAGALD